MADGTPGESQPLQPQLRAMSYLKLLVACCCYKSRVQGPGKDAEWIHGRENSHCPGRSQSQYQAEVLHLSKRKRRLDSLEAAQGVEWTGWISWQSIGLLRVFSNTTVQKYQFFSAQLSSQANSHIHSLSAGALRYRA